jgi:hypothetical protein
MAAQAPLRPGSALVLVRATQRCRPASAWGQPHTTRPNERWMSLVRYHVPLHWKLREGFRDLMESRRPISRVLSVLIYASVSQHRTVIPLGVQSPTRSSSLPATRRLATSLRDGSSLAAYLALLRLGFTEPPSLPKVRWALTPPFHPYRTAGVTRKYGGLLSVALSVTRSSRRMRPGVTWQSTLWSPDFPRCLSLRSDIATIRPTTIP